jgi:MipA family protein
LGDVGVKFSAFGLALAAFFVGGAASAADLPSLKDTSAALPPDWIVTVTATAGIGPTYPGAQTYSFYGWPGISLRRSDQPERFSSPDDSMSVAIYHNDWFAIGPAGRWINDRDPKTDHALFGMNYVNTSIEIGGFAEWEPVSWGRIRAEVRKAVTGYDGWAATLEADVWRDWGPLRLSAGPRLEFGNQQYANAFFTVTPFQAALNQLSGGPLTPYSASGGLAAAGGALAARYDINETWRISGVGVYETLTGSDANSPLVTHTGSRNQFSAGLGIAYRFRTDALSWLPNL